MKIVSWNVNGIMPCLNNGSLEPLYDFSPDLICYQETRTSERPEAVPRYYHYWNSSAQGGYAGVMSAARKEPIHVEYGLGDTELDKEGRLVTLEFEGFYSVNAYFPQSQGSIARYNFRMEWDEALREKVKELDEQKGIRSHNIKDKDAWIVFPGTHEAIISQEDFQRVQAIMEAASDRRQRSLARTSAQRTTLTNFFEGKIVCADCGGRMYFHRKRVDKISQERWYAFYECSTAVNHRYGSCTRHYLRQDKLGKDVLAAVQLQVQAALDYDRLLGKLRGSSGEASIRDRQNAQITSLDLKLSALAKKRTRLYDDYVDGVLDEDEYTFAKQSYDKQYAELSRCRDEAIQRRTRFQEAMSADNKWITLMKSISTAETLTKELVDEAVELVKVHADGSIELVLKYGDIYALTLESVRNVQEAM